MNLITVVKLEASSKIAACLDNVYVLLYINIFHWNIYCIYIFFLICAEVIGRARPLYWLADFLRQQWFIRFICIGIYAVIIS